MHTTDRDPLLRAFDYFKRAHPTAQDDEITDWVLDEEALYLAGYDD